MNFFTKIKVLLGVTFQLFFILASQEHEHFKYQHTIVLLLRQTEISLNAQDHLSLKHQKERRNGLKCPKEEPYSVLRTSMWRDGCFHVYKRPGFRATSKLITSSMKKVSGDHIRFRIRSIEKVPCIESIYY